MLRVELENRETLAFRPGNRLRGKIVWEHSVAPDSMTLVLGWKTEGKGNEDSGSAIQQTWHPTAESGWQAFEWILPRGPLSLDGTLVRIRWSLECQSRNPDESATLPILLSHLDRPVILRSVTKQQTAEA